ncbi:hypothetical protein Harman_07300 [Haloarcula mannanilytica]|uniref:Uncharacterized protein n=1 Tax=Haloarcula mannanilytica TaxID=2509225 RepID=A0A4C2EEA3_9EURY|nr:hypothetical protein [Haloarcula mannanilytica]GCF12795.1 hypothetical protein Harman_07300 [Haloarcula mannanilytica]
MDTPTFLEVEVERDAVASALDAVPGVAVVDDATAVSTPPPTGPDSADDSQPDGPGLTDRLGSLWRQWGLLGTGLSLIALGAATAGLWWYRRRNADDTDGQDVDDYTTEWDTDSAVDTPAPSESAVDTPSPTDSDFELTAPAGDADDTPTPGTQETALASEATPTESENRQRDTGLETEQSDVAGFETKTDTFGEEETEADETDTDERPEAKIDPAPLLGAAFLILSSAIGRWATRDRSDRA